MTSSSYFTSLEMTKSPKKVLLLLQSPAILTLLLWMIVPLSMTIYFSLIRYNLLYPDQAAFEGLSNYRFLVTEDAFYPALINTLLMVGSILLITIVSGLVLAVLINRVFWGRGFVRLLLISPFFIMPTVNALVWKNMFMHPVYGIFAFLSGIFDFVPIDWLSDLPLLSIVMIVSWQWMPFALLVFMTSLQSQDREQLEAATMDGAGAFSKFFYFSLPHLKRSIAVVIMIQLIFHLSLFAEIFITTSGGPGFDSTNLAFMIFTQALLNFDVGIASAGGVIAVILANIVAIFMIRLIGKNLMV